MDTRLLTALQIDASAHCQLACPACPTASGATLPVLGAGHLDPDAFDNLLAANPALREIELSNYGEMFLNPRLRDILRIAFDRGVVLHADNGANMNHAPEDALEALVQYRFRSLTVSIDGATSDAYSQYRVKGNFERVIGHIRKLNDLKRKRSTGFPALTWQFIVFGHNEDEIDAARAKATELGMAFRPKISWDDDVSPIRNPELVQLRTGLPATRAAHYQTTGKTYMRGICHQIWNAPVLNWNGRILGCCRNFWGEFGGNAFHDGLDAAISSSKLPAARRALMGQGEMDPSAPCITCDLYLTMKEDGRWITREELDRTSGQQGVATSIVVDVGASPATHVDVFLTAGHEVNRLLLARPPAAQRFHVGRSHSVLANAAAGKYMVYALPKQLDPEFRKHYPALPPVTMPIEIAVRPAAQEFHIQL